MSLLDVNDINKELDYKTCVINQLKEFIRKFYGNYSPTIPQYYIEGYLVEDIDKLIYIIGCSVEKLMNSYVYIGYVQNGLAVAITENPGLMYKLTEKNGSGSYITFEKILNFLANFDPSKYSRDYNFFYNKYYEPTRCK